MDNNHWSVTKNVGKRRVDQQDYHHEKQQYCQERKQRRLQQSLRTSPIASPKTMSIDHNMTSPRKNKRPFEDFRQGQERHHECRRIKPNKPYGFHSSKKDNVFSGSSNATMIPNDTNVKSNDATRLEQLSHHNYMQYAQAWKWNNTSIGGQHANQEGEQQHVIIGTPDEFSIHEY